MLPQPFLPNEDADPDTRRSQLLARRACYEITQAYVPQVPWLKQVPWMEDFSLGYWRRRVRSFARLPLNMVRAWWRQRFHALARPDDYRGLFSELRAPALAD